MLPYPIGRYPSGFLGTSFVLKDTDRKNRAASGIDSVVSNAPTDPGYQRRLLLTKVAPQFIGISDSFVSPHGNVHLSLLHSPRGETLAVAGYRLSKDVEMSHAI